MFKFKDLSIGSKLALGFGVVLALLAVVAFTGYFSIRGLTGTNNKVIDESRHSDAVMEMKTSLIEIMEAEMTFLFDPTRKEALADYEKHKEEFKKWEAVWRKAIEEERVKNFEVAYNAMIASIEQGLKLAKEGKIEEARKWEIEQSDPKLEVTKELMAKEEEISKKDADKAIAGAVATTALGNTLILIISSLAVILGILLAILITRAISNPVKAVADYADNLAKTGDLSKSIQIPGVTLKEGQAVQSKDEAALMAGAFSRLVDNLRSMAKQAAIVAAGDLTQEVTGKGDLPTAFNTMVKNLRELVIKVLQTAQHVSVSSQQLSSSAQQINSTTQEVSSTVQQIAKGAESTAQRVEETSKVMEQMGSSVSQVATSSQQTAAAATQANTSAQSGGEAVKETVKTMEKIFGATSSSSVVVKKLGEKAEEIGKIVDVITNIADQTNLLALNAAIEAARAGEAGRGFAVVAEEVRKLAEGASKSSDEISNLIKGANKDIESAVKSMEDSNKEVVQGKEVVAKAETAFAEILKAAGNAATMVQQVSAATQQMAAGSKQVVKSIDEIASSAEEAASATEQASASTEEMAASAQELANMAIELRELVGKFKTGSEIEKEVVAAKPRKKFEVPAAAEKKETAAERLKAVRERMHKGVTEKPKEA